ncbi:hypothetical protein [Arthrobacter sp. QXT-31]|nr:hypothetical protein [Arthrobacter sp. QXT-31]
MTADDEKDPPVPADLVGAPQRVRRDQVAEDEDQPVRKAPADEPNE